jgi:hypothetical protein
LVVGAEVREHVVHVIDPVTGHEVGDHGVGQRVPLELQGRHGGQVSQVRHVLPVADRGDVVTRGNP